MTASEQSDDEAFQTEVLSWALKYAARGWWVFPVHSVAHGRCTCGNSNCDDRGKHPAVPRGLKEASNDPEKITAWFAVGGPLRNVGIVTGAISGITVIDIDMGEGKVGAESWKAVNEGHIEPNTLMAQTGGGGLHLFFKYSSALKTGTNVLGKDIDVRNDGGYVVAPPSRHRSDGHYEWN